MAPDVEIQQQSTLVDLLCSYPAISDLLCSYLGMANFLVLCQQCKALYRLKNDRLRLNIGIMLRDFVTDSNSFRSQLAKYDAVISGSFALNFFELGVWKTPDLDLFVEAGQHMHGLADYIQTQEGYDHKQYSEYKMDVEHITFSNRKRPGQRIRVTVTNGPPVGTILRCAYTTMCVNIITWNMAYSVFPVQTIVHHKFYSLRALDYTCGSMLKERSNQGWTTRDGIWPDLSNAPCPLVTGHRRVGDRLSLVFPLDAKGIQRGSSSDIPIDFAQFDVTESASVFVERSGYRQLQSEQLTSLALRHVYSYASTTWHRFLMDRLERWIQYELSKLNLEERPEQYTFNLPLHSNISIPHDFSPPGTWDYADDQVPKWYLEWEQMQTEEGSRKIRNRDRRRRGF